MPKGRVKFFDVEKGFGFITSEDRTSVYVNASVLPDGLTSLRPGTRVEFDMVDGRRGPQALSVQLLERSPSVARNRRTPAKDMVLIVEDLMQLLDGASTSLRRGRYPEKQQAEKIASVLRAVADDFEA
ncbi:cold-shock protein [Helcobacillus massiliensis]|uniref:CspA family cold shock protein n=1 Tax=Helcobacillus massiliensis TaxID=521392 RepID=A0A839R0E1_9MICO|nr:cold-shock protein [Helcobacillus massiliensis]MBB3023197.1 CspA family cold shock protein [Helcobacillus massiliensis]MCT1556627.1 cold-shock protein [Helcobacillus massiliensis]MCT2035821.1 cold-shock protein [Helcobacillus massiliensis]MCT2331097.1 cold-shock protein [Helcobacillus massiliensis]MDK7742023.1 cold-shock protein [Helcobacillus massiliensis]